MKIFLCFTFLVVFIQCVPEEKLPVCATAQDLAKYDGQRVYVVGKSVFMKRASWLYKRK